MGTSWIDQLPIDRSKLLPPADKSSVRAVEERLGVELPDELKHFLTVADGGFVGNFIIHSAGEGLHPSETLLSANSDREEDFPLLLIGRDASFDFGYRRSDLPAAAAPVYFILEETWELDRVADSFQDFLVQLCQLPPGKPFRPRRKR